MAKQRTAKKYITKKTVVLHSGEAPWDFYRTGENAQSAFNPLDHGILWFPGIKYRVTVEAIGHEHKDWGCGPTLEEAKRWLKTDAAFHKKDPAQLISLRRDIAWLEEADRERRWLDKYLAKKAKKGKK